MAAGAEVLIFEVEGQRHALPVGQVRELLPALSMTPVPDAAAGVEGVINLRGVIVPVVDVRQRFGFPAKALSPADHFIVACIQERLIVLHVDRALGLVMLEANALAAAELLQSEGIGRVVQGADGAVLLHEARYFLPQAGNAAVRATGKEKQP